jgi:hypothetical protein
MYERLRVSRSDDIPDYSGASLQLLTLAVYRWLYYKAGFSPVNNYASAS